MIIIKNLSKSIKGYLRNYQDVPPKIQDLCALCHHKLHKHGSYKRTVVTKHSVLIIPIYRWKCSNCSQSYSLLPDFLSPYKVFIGWIQESVAFRHFIQGNSYNNIQSSIVSEHAGGISSRTLKRWVSQWRKKITPSIQRLAKYLLEVDPLFQPHLIIKLFNKWHAFLELLKCLWNKIHTPFRYPFYGFFQWINQLI